MVAAFSVYPARQRGISGTTGTMAPMGSGRAVLPMIPRWRAG